MATTLTVLCAEREVTLDPQGRYTVGRDPSADIVVDHQLISRQHALLRVESGAWVFEDTGSRNGCFRDGERVTTFAITGPTELRLGDPGVGPSLTLRPAPPRRLEPPVPVRSGSASMLTGDLGKVSAVHVADKPAVTVGRAPDNDVVVDDLVVSRHHAELRRDRQGRYEIVDLRSHNGTFVNGSRVDRVTVAENDLISIGHHMFVLVGGTLEESIDAGAVKFDADGLCVDLPNGRRILDQASFSLGERSLMAVVGPSGSGKSTLLNALTGFRPADSGQVVYGGRSLYAAYNDLRNRIGYVPQDDVLHRQLSARQALTYAAKLRFPSDVSTVERRERVGEVLGELGLTRHADSQIGRLSGGQRKRASVGLELLTKPSLLFLDEPTSGLDPGYERALTRLLRDLADGGRTVIVVTHSVQSLDLCDRVLVLAPGGAVAYFGPPDAAVGYFGAGSYPEVFEKLESEAESPWGRRFGESPEYERYVAGPRAAIERGPDSAERSEPEPPTKRGWFAQFTTLTGRYLSVIGKDRRFVALLALQAPLLGLIMVLALPPGEFEPSPGAVRFSAAAVVLAVVFAGVTWLGLSNSIREIVKEEAIYERERASGLSVSAYIASKAFVLGVITVVQAAVLCVIATARQGSGWGAALFEPALLELTAAAALTGLAAMTLGLLLSALFRSADRAGAILPLVLLLQLLLSGGFQDIVNQPVLREASYATSTQWGFSAAAATVDLNRLQVFNDCLFAVSPGGELDADDVELTFLCIRLGLADTDLAISALRDYVVAAQTLTPAEVQGVLRQIDRMLANQSGEPEEILAELERNDEAGSRQVDRIIAVVARDRALRFWDQTPTDWLINAGVLGGFLLAGLVGSWLVLVRRDRKRVRS